MENENVWELIKRIENFEPENNQWCGLEELLNCLFENSNPDLGLEAMFRIYERYPEEDNDYLWGMLHGIEDIPNYESKLLESIDRKPSFFTTLMINRIINAGIQEIENRKLLDVLKSISENLDVSSDIRNYANSFIEEHLSK